MRAFKSCKTEYNLSGPCKTVRLGTFAYYRNLDKSFSIADVDEGRFIVSYRFRDSMPVKLSREKYDLLLGPLLGGVNRLGADVSGALMAGTMVQGEDDGGVLIAGGPPGSIISVPYVYPNCLIFCASLNKVDPSKIQGDYNSCYEITDLHSFANFCCKALDGQLRMSHFDKRVHNIGLADLLDSSGYGIAYDIQVVDYVDEKHFELSREEVENLTQQVLYQKFMRSLYCKEKSKYVNDREVRIIFRVVHRRFGILPIAADYFDLNVKPIDSMVTSIE